MRIGLLPSDTSQAAFLFEFDKDHFVVVRFVAGRRVLNRVMSPHTPRNVFSLRHLARDSQDRGQEALIVLSGAWRDGAL